MAIIGAEAILGSSNDSSDALASSRGLLRELVWIVFGLRSILPNDKLTWLRPKLRKRLGLAALAQACYDSAESLVADLDIDEVVDLTDPGLFEALDVMQNLTARGNAKSKQPILVVQGLADVSVLPEVVVNTYNISCQLGNEVHLQLYPDMDHTPVIRAAAPSFLQWIDDRFNGVKTSGQCSNATLEPFDSVNVYAPPDVD